MVWKISLQHIGIGNEHLYHSLCKSLHVTLPDLFILKKSILNKFRMFFVCFIKKKVKFLYNYLAFQFLEDLETLGQLGEDINDTVGEVGVLGVLLELKSKIIITLCTF